MGIEKGSRTKIITIMGKIPSCLRIRNQNALIVIQKKVINELRPKGNELKGGSRYVNPPIDNIKDYNWKLKYARLDKKFSEHPAEFQKL